MTTIRRLVLLFVFALSACNREAVSVAANGEPPAQSWPPNFEQYPTSDTLTGPAAVVDRSVDPGPHQPQLSGYTKPDFAGHLAFVVWGCGTSCTSHLVLDLRTGQQYADTLVDFSCGEVTYRANSDLVITGPDTAPDADFPCRAKPTRYFIWNGSELSEIKLLQRVTPAPYVADDSILRIPLKNGDTALFVSTPGAEAGVRYTLDRHFDGSPFFGVGVQYYEAYSYILVHDSTGQRMMVDGRPLFAPGGKELVVASFGLETDNLPNSLNVFRLAPDTLRPEFSIRPPDWGPKDPVWVGGDTIRFTRIWAREERRPPAGAPAALVRIDGKWRLEGVVPDTLPEDTTEVH